MNVMEVIFTQGNYRYVQKGELEINGRPDYRMQEQCWYTKKWSDIYLFDNQMQMITAIDDYQYTLWLAGKPAYRKWD